MSKTIWILAVMSFHILGFTSHPFAQIYPSRPITLVLPMAPGDGVDVAGRAMGDELSKLLKVPIVPLNKPGAAATLGADLVVKAKKDGYTILFTSSPAVVSAKVLQPENVPYEPFRDLTPLGLSTHTPMLMTIRGDAPYKNFKEMIDYAKKNPGKIRCGVMGVGSMGHFNLEIIKMVTGADIIVVPFKGAAPSITATLGGHVETVIQSVATVISHIQSGALKAAITSTKFPELPDVPTLKELGYPQELLSVWYAFFAPADVPPEVKTTLVSAVEKVVMDPSITSKLRNLGMVQIFEPPDRLIERMRAEHKIVEEIAKKSGMVK